MSGFAKIVLSVALVAIIVLSIVVASVAWFTSNPEVDANDVTLNAAKTLTVTFDSSVSGTTDKYNGQIGNVPAGQDDAPFVYQAGSFTVNLTSLSATERRGRIHVEFGTVTIETPSSGTISDVIITDLFHITADIYEEDEEGTYVKDETSGKFRAATNEDTSLTHYSKAIDPLTISDDGILMNGASPASFDKGTYVLAFTYTFLPEDAYQVWSAATLPAQYKMIYGYERTSTGEYVGVETYTPYKAKYHAGLQRYDRSGDVTNEHPYVYTPSADGGYVRIVTSYTTSNAVKYAVSFTEDANGTYYKYNDNYLSESSATAAEKASGVKGTIVPGASGSGGYIKVGDDYLLYNTYDRKNGFPYSDDRYLGERFTFKVTCTVEEV